MMGRPPDLSAEGWRVDAIVDVSVLVAAGVLVAGLVLLAWLLLRRAPCLPQGAALEAASASARASDRAVVLLAAGFFVAVELPLGLLAARDLNVLRRGGASPGESALRVEVLARQWGWESRLAGRDGAFGTEDDVVLAGEIRLPAGRLVHLEVASADVVHGFHVPGLRVQQDVIPGHVARVATRAGRAGVAQLACSQFCGASHARMLGRVMILTPEDHAAWLAEAERRALAEAPARGPSWGWTWTGEP